MNLIKYNPIKSIFDTGFDTFLDRFFDDSSISGGACLPRVDVKETGDNYVLEADLPGLTEKDIEVRVDNGVLILSSARKEEKEEKKDNYLIKERRETSFSRSFVLPKNTDRDNIDAKYANGVLTLTIPKTEEAKPKSIEVKSHKG
ncbi:MAG: Hsp20/alpha crystallin family protein [Spirochaetales bacterium]|nr:Hsp20/alpha crystallin family protein [Spirochaetales bacterium]